LGVRSPHRLGGPVVRTPFPRAVQHGAVAVALALLSVARGEGQAPGKPGAAQAKAPRLGPTDILVRSVRPPGEQGPGKSVRSYGLRYRARARFRTRAAGPRLVPLRASPSEVRPLGRPRPAGVVAGTSELAVLGRLELAGGRFLTEDDDRSVKNVVVLGAAL